VTNLPLIEMHHLQLPKKSPKKKKEEEEESKDLIFGFSSLDHFISYNFTMVDTSKEVLYILSPLEIVFLQMIYDGF